MWTDEEVERFKRQKLPITFNPHLFVREAQRNFELNKVVETVKTGKVVANKCVEPRKICFSRYFGKENKTYTIIAIFHYNYVEVKTAWLKEGR